MPFLDNLEAPPTDARATTRMDTGADPQPADTPSWSSTMGAAYREGNSVGSAMSSNDLVDANMVREPNYNAWNEIKGTKYEQYANDFAQSNNANYTNLLKQSIDREEGDRRTLAASGWRGVVGGLAMGALDPLTWVPIAGEAAKAEGAWSIGRAVVAGAKIGGAAMAAQEAGLQATQVTRTPEESLINVGTGVLLGGVLGAAGAAVHGAVKGGVQTATKALQDLHENVGTPLAQDLSRVSQPNAAGAEAARRATLGELSIDPGWGRADVVADATKSLSPNMRLNLSATAEGREIGQQLGENTLYQMMHSEGDSVGSAAETNIRSVYRARLADANEAHDAIFSSMKRAGTNMSSSDFEARVGEAMRNGDVDTSNPYVQQAAESWRKKVFDPWKNEAIDQGLLDPNVDPKTADSYFSRFWDRDKLVQQEGEFKRVGADHYEAVIGNDYERSSAALRDRIANLDQQVADLQSSPEDRTRLMDVIGKQGEALDAANGEHLDTWNKIVDLRNQAAAAAERGDNAAAKTLRQQARDARIAGGDKLNEYLSQRSALRARSRRIDMSSGGIATRIDSLVNSLADNEAANRVSMSRLVTKGKVFLKEMTRLDPEVYAERLSGLRTAFNDMVDKSQKAIERMTKERDALASERDASGASVGAEHANMLDRYLAQETKRHEALNSLSERLQKTEDFDVNATRQEVADGVNRLIDHMNELSLARGEKSQRLKDRLSRLDPAVIGKQREQIAEMKRGLVRDFYDRWEIGKGGQGVEHLDTTAKPNFRAAAEDIMDQVHDHLTGNGHGDQSSHPDYYTPITRGPLKDRPFTIPDSKVTPWLKSNVKAVGARYARVMASEIELTRRFGRADMKDQFATIHAAYSDLEKRISAAKSAKEVNDIIGKGEPGAKDNFAAWMRGQGVDQATKERALTWLRSDHEQVKTDVAAMRDLIRGTYKRDANSGNYARMVRGVMAFNYIRQMGNFMAANMALLYRPAMVHGLSSYMKDGIAPLMRNLGDIVKGHPNGFSGAVAEARRAGVGVERLMHSRIASMTEIGDPYAQHSAVETLLHTGADVATRWNGMAAFFDFGRSLASVMTQHRIIEGIMSGGEKDARFLAYLGIDRRMAPKIRDELKANLKTIDGVHVAHTENWASADTVRAFRSAIAKDVGTMLHEKSVGDLPLWTHTPTGRMVSQFRTFNLAAHQRTMIRGLQESPARFVSGLVGMTSIGMLGAYLTAMRGGKSHFDKFKADVEGNPAHLIAEGLDKSGVFTLPFEVANLTEAMTGGMGQQSRFRFNPIKTPIEALGRHATGGSGEPYYGGGAQDPLSSLLGPSAGLAGQLALAAGGGINKATGKPVEAKQRRAAAGLVPFSSYLGMKELTQVLGGDSPYFH